MTVSIDVRARVDHPEPPRNVRTGVANRRVAGASRVPGDATASSERWARAHAQRGVLSSELPLNATPARSSARPDAARPVGVRPGLESRRPRAAALRGESARWTGVPSRVLAQPRPVGVPECAPESGREQVLWLAGAAMFTFLVVVLIGFVGISGGLVSPPATTTVVQVEPGDTMWELAKEHAPGADTGEVVRRIVELNGLQGSVARPGESLIVPSSGR